MSAPDTSASSPFQTVSDLLSQAVCEVEPKLRAVSEADVSTPPAQGKWSRKQVLGHLIDSAANNHQRFVRTQLQGEYDCPGYDQEDWVRVEDPQSIPWTLLVDLWTAYNRYLAEILQRIPASEAEMRVTIKGKPVTLEFVAQDYIRHMKQHLGQMGM